MLAEIPNPQAPEPTAATNSRTVWAWPSAVPRIAAFLLAAMLPAGSASAGQPSLLLVDAASGRTLQAIAADVPRYPASLTKMMTLYLLFEALDHKRIGLGTRMRVSPNAAGKPRTSLGLRAGQSIGVHDAILALTTESANDVATVIGEALAGSEPRFAARMTGKARALGMRHTSFGNASGLPNPAHRTTARDMAVLARALLRDYPEFYHYFGARQFHYRGITHANHNRLLGAYPGVDGMKTGFTRAAGYNLVASAKRNGRRLIGVVMGSPSKNARAAAMTRLLDRGFVSPGMTSRVAVATPPTQSARRSSNAGRTTTKAPQMLASRN
ncbi:MAG: D-alanyl-D-alanine carboxypeptidase family protein [Methylotetracoccus sp.]